MQEGGQGLGQELEEPEAAGGLSLTGAGRQRETPAEWEVAVAGVQGHNKDVNNRRS